MRPVELQQEHVDQGAIPAQYPLRLYKDQNKQSKQYENTRSVTQDKTLNCKEYVNRDNMLRQKANGDLVMGRARDKNDDAHQPGETHSCPL